MRSGCLLPVGAIIGALLMLLWWPHPPRGSSFPSAADVRAVVSDAYLSRTVQQRVSGMTIPRISRVVIVSAPPASLVAHADIGVGPLAVPASLETHPRADNGAVRIELVSADVAGIPVPTPLISALSGTIDDAAQRLAGPNARVIGVRVTAGGLEIAANYR